MGISDRSLRIVSLLGACLIGLIISFTNRFFIYSDCISYLNIAHDYLRHPWLENANGIWGPLLPVLLADAFYLLRPSMEHEIFVADGVLYATYVFVLLAYLFFDRQLRLYMWKRFPAQWSEEKSRIVFLFGFATIVAQSSCLLSTSIEPDLLVGGFFILSCGFLLHFKCIDLNFWGILCFALTLTLGYFAKAIFFPLALVFIACLYFALRENPKRILHVFSVTVLFFIFSSLQWIPLSLQKHRLTFGDTGKVNYVWYVSRGLDYWTFQQKNIDGTPLAHPFHLVSSAPLIYSFEGGKGTFPNWYDPSYWMEGLHVPFQPVRQVEVLLLNAQRLLTILSGHVEAVPTQPLGASLSLVGLLSVFLLAGNYRKFWPGIPWELLIPSLAGLGAYILVFCFYRYVFSFLFILLVGLYGTLVARLDETQVVAARCISTGLLLVTFVTLFGRSIGDFRAQESEQYHAAHPPALLDNPDARSARALQGLGVQEGTLIAELGDLKDAYFFQLAGIKVISTAPRPDDFWNASALEQKKILDIFSSTGAKELIARIPFPPRTLDGWAPIGDSGYLLHSLE